MSRTPLKDCPSLTYYVKTNYTNWQPSAKEWLDEYEPADILWNGKNYVLTDLSLSTSHRISVEYDYSKQAIDTKLDSCLFGRRANSQLSAAYVVWAHSGSYFSSNTPLTTSPMLFGTQLRYESSSKDNSIRHHLTFDPQFIQFDDNYYKVDLAPGESDVGFAIGTVNSAGIGKREVDTRRWMGHIYRLTIEDGNKTIHNFFPMKRKSDGQLGYLDIITGSFYKLN